MSGKKREAMLAEAFRARVRQMLAAGYSEAQIARATGKSAKHVAQIAAQERQGGAPE